MWFKALASDYDGTLATDGLVTEATLEALKGFVKSGRQLLLVTGRRTQDLLDVFPETTMFDIVVSENGAVIYNPSTKEETLVAPEAPQNLIEMLEKANVQPLEIGKCIVATRTPNENIVLNAIQELGLEHQVIFNKGAVMILPPGVNKATGLAHALNKLGLSRHNLVGVGDAQNDLAFLTASECSAAVSNALDSVKEAADIRTNKARGAGVEELINMMVESDLAETQLNRHDILIGTTEDGSNVSLNPRDSGILIVGTSGSGKSTAVTGILERLAEKEYQFALIDPEGDFENLEEAITVGNSQHAPTAEEAAQQLKGSGANIAINLLGIPLADRPQFLATFLPLINSMRDSVARPHWLAIDEAHHMIPNGEFQILDVTHSSLRGIILITVHPDEIAPSAFQFLDQVLVVGQQPKEMLEIFFRNIGVQADLTACEKGLNPGEAFYWKKNLGLTRLKIASSHTERRRHLRKYAEGDVGKEKSFYFKGPDNKLNLRVQNLILFVQISEGIDDETWLHHLHRGEYSQWFLNSIKDEDLAQKIAAIEEDRALSATESKAAIHDLIKERYTASAVGPHLNSENILS